MKKKIAFLVILVVVCVMLGMCGSCGSSESKSDSVASSESASKSESRVDMGNATTNSTNELRSDLSVSGVKVEGDTIINEAEVTISEFLKSITDSWFWRSILIVIMVLLATGNLHPDKNFTLWDKKTV